MKLTQLSAALTMIIHAGVNTGPRERKDFPMLLDLAQWVVQVAIIIQLSSCT